jgi:hypothetical protein
MEVDNKRRKARGGIGAATKARMLAFWQAYRDAGRPPLPWRESLRTARARPKVPTIAEWRAAKQQHLRDFLDPAKWGK